MWVVSEAIVPLAGHGTELPREGTSVVEGAMEGAGRMRLKAGGEGGKLHLGSTRMPRETGWSRYRDGRRRI